MYIIKINGYPDAYISVKKTGVYVNKGQYNMLIEYSVYRVENRSVSMIYNKELYRFDLKADINGAKTCFFTGHRILSEPVRLQLADRLDELLPQMVKAGFRTFLSGGALGFDLMAAKAVLKLRKRRKHIRLIFVLPCMEHTEKWRCGDARHFQDLLVQAGESICLYDSYRQNCMKKRNLFMVQHSACCVSALRNNRATGTAQTVRLAVDHEIPVHNLLESTLLSTMLKRHEQASEIKRQKQQNAP